MPAAPATLDSPLLLGTRRDDGSPVALPAAALLRHVMALGSSGSGKTVLAKVVVEEVLRRGIPAICVDPQGDLASLVLTGEPAALAERGVDPDLVAALRERVDPVIYTPASRKGIAICADPVERGLAALEPAERMQAFSRTAAMVVTLLGYELDADDGAGLCAALDSVLGEMAAAGHPAESLHALAARLAELETQSFAGLERLVEPKRLRAACQRLARLDVGARRMLFHEGVPIDIDVLAGRAPEAAPPPGKVRLSILYLNTLHTQEDKDFFVAALVSRLYGWMLRHPASEPQLLFYIDEVSPYVPPVRKPAAKDPLVLLFKQARKYGVCCLMATQNPGDVDYKAMAQFGTWGLGRLTTRQDLKKLAPAVKALAPTASDAVLDALPALKPGEFALLSPDHFAEPCPLRTRWLATRHETYDEDRIEALTSSALRARFAPLEAAAPGPMAPAARPVARTQPMAAVTPPPQVPAAAPATPARDPGALAQLLAGRRSMSADEFAAAAGVGDRKARSLLAELVAAGLARAYKEGRTGRWFAVGTGGRPDLDLPATVVAVVARVEGAAIPRIAAAHARQPLLGVLGTAETLERAEPVHRLLYRVEFAEQVPRPLFGGLLGTATDERLGSVYLHPATLELLVFHPQHGLAFGARPAEHASDVVDLDGAVTFVEVPPGSLALVESDCARRQSETAVQRALQERYRVTAGRVSELFVPLWRILLRSGGGAGYRVVTVDAIVGQPVEWP